MHDLAKVMHDLAEEAGYPEMTFLLRSTLGNVKEVTDSMQKLYMCRH